MLSRKTTAVVATAVLAALLAACGTPATEGDQAAVPTSDGETAAGAGEDSEEPQEDDPTAQETTPDDPISMKFLELPYVAPEIVAEARGIFADNGLAMEYVANTQYGTPATAILASGQVNGTYALGLNQGSIISSEDLPITGVLVSYAHGPDLDEPWLLAPADSPITSPEQLEGEQIGVAGIGSIDNILYTYHFEQIGIDPDSVNRVTVPQTSMCETILSGDLAAGSLYALSAYPCMAEHGDALKPILVGSEITDVSQEMQGVYFFSDQYIEENPEAIRRFVTSIQQAAEFMTENPEEAASIVAEKTGLPEENIKIPYFPNNLCILPEVADQWNQINIEAGVVPEGTVADWYTNEFNEKC